MKHKCQECCEEYECHVSNCDSAYENGFCSNYCRAIHFGEVKNEKEYAKKYGKATELMRGMLSSLPPQIEASNATARIRDIYKKGDE